MNTIIYCRVSSKEQVDGTSLESQESACLDYAARARPVDPEGLHRTGGVSKVC